MDYKEAGVDVEKGEQFISRLKGLLSPEDKCERVSEIGSFAALYKMDEERFISASTDGVGTKLLLAIETGIYDSIGIDLVAMCVNDLICNGSKPLFFLDYLATGNLNLDSSEKIMKGIVKGCRESSCFLIGGETAEMPDLYSDGHFDLAGFAVGEVYKDDLLTGNKITDGDELVAIEASGFHANGYSLIRKLINKNETELKKDLLRPTKIYVNEVLKILKEQKTLIKSIANITGGGIENINRMNPNFVYELSSLPAPETLAPEVFEIIKRSRLSEKQLYTTFNMGMGLVLATDKAEDLIYQLKCLNLRAFKIGNLRAKH